ncbi:type II CRISPR-associated endonuclease Cas1 [Alkalibacillus haloalkaliphilus]|uniref:type II CRISPR-associated endonuclease Cas1 n=1 Tax=Alkalibacillus haloalkaliphilus TaxID=94136 RepID=UPI0003062BFF|nr:type II CRISPR-associated endonuclease Cas1 [Alkalibacillus haloalkaliphilus]
MGWRVVHVSQVDQLSLHLDNLRVYQGDLDVKVPLNDIFALVIEDLSCKLSTRLMVELSKNNILVLLCNQQYLPECIIQPVSGHYGQYKQMMKQLNWTDEMKNLMWQAIIRKKVHNQMQVMLKNLVELHRVEKMQDLKSYISPGDEHNIEGQAARIYFNSFFGHDYRRDNDDYVENAALNYGYSILHSAIARTIVAKGLIPGLGIHHIGHRNPHNLASDLIEPYRPIVDHFVIKKPPEGYLTKEYRIELINLLHAKIQVNNQSQTVIRSIELFINSLFDAFETGKSEKLKLPNIEKLSFHEL